MQAGPDEAQSAQAAHPRLSWRSIPWMGGVFIVAISALAAYDIFRNYHTAAAETARELDTHARVLAEQTARTLQAIDLVLRREALALGISVQDVPDDVPVSRPELPPE